MKQCLYHWYQCSREGIFWNIRKKLHSSLLRKIQDDCNRIRIVCFSNFRHLLSGPATVRTAYHIWGQLRHGTINRKTQALIICLCTRDHLPTPQVNPRHHEVCYWKVSSSDYLPKNYNDLASLPHFKEKLFSFTVEITI
jgi:hypothetical protein